MRYYYPWEVEIIIVNGQRRALLKTNDQRIAEYQQRKLPLPTELYVDVQSESS